MNAGVPAHRTDRPILAIVAVLLCVLALSAGDAVIKLTSANFPIWQLYVLRSLLVVPALLVLLRWREPATPLVPKRVRWAPLLMTLLSARLAGEPVGWVVTHISEDGAGRST